MGMISEGGKGGVRVFVGRGRSVLLGMREPRGLCTVMWISGVITFCCCSGVHIGEHHLTSSWRLSLSTNLLPEYLAKRSDVSEAWP
jgi:hypothetical protein